MRVKVDWTSSILCKMCGRCIVLGKKSGNVMISNWTRHVTNCVKKQPTATKRRQLTLPISPSLSPPSVSSPEFALPSPAPPIPTVGTPAVHCIKIQEASRSHIPLCNYLTANILFFLRDTKTFQNNLEPSFASGWIEQLLFFPIVQV